MQKTFKITFWLVLFQLVFSFFLYKIVQYSQAFIVIYIADTLILLGLSYTFYTKNFPKKKKSNQPKPQSVDLSVLRLAKKVHVLHKLNLTDFSNQIVTLLKAYNFQQIQKVQVQGEDNQDGFDSYILARHEGELTEIRFLATLQELTENNITAIANKFRDSTSQATTFILATSAKTNDTTRLQIHNSGINFKIFDQSIIEDLVCLIAPDAVKKKSNKIKLLSISLIEYLTNTLNKYKDHLSEQSKDASKIDPNALTKILATDVDDSEKPLNDIDTKETGNKAKDAATDTKQTDDNADDVAADTEQTDDNADDVAADTEQTDDNADDVAADTEVSSETNSEVLDPTSQDQSQIEAEASSQAIVANEDDFSFDEMASATPPTSTNSMDDESLDDFPDADEEPTTQDAEEHTESKTDKDPQSESVQDGTPVDTGSGVDLGEPPEPNQEPTEEPLVVDQEVVLPVGVDLGEPPEPNQEPTEEPLVIDQEVVLPVGVDLGEPPEPNQEPTEEPLVIDQEVVLPVGVDLGEPPEPSQEPTEEPLVIDQEVVLPVGVDLGEPPEPSQDATEESLVVDQVVLLVDTDSGVDLGEPLEPSQDTAAVKAQSSNTADMTTNEKGNENDLEQETSKTIILNVNDLGTTSLTMMNNLSNDYAPRKRGRRK